jgi:SAM-dependent methyltransferase
MTPHETGRNYDAIAAWWLDRMNGSDYGLSALQHALTFADRHRTALDVGCGGEGRFFRVLLENGFQCTGVDVSEKMLESARSRFPQVALHLADICTWIPPEKYDLITAWDSTFHLPLESQEPVLQKLCAILNKGGVLLFTGGGVESPGEIRGEMAGREFSYSSLGVSGFLDCLERFGCSMLYLNYDQWPERHVTFIARKNP